MPRHQREVTKHAQVRKDQRFAYGVRFSTGGGRGVVGYYPRGVTLHDCGGGRAFQRTLSVEYDFVQQNPRSSSFAKAASPGTCAGFEDPGHHVGRRKRKVG